MKIRYWNILVAVFGSFILLSYVAASDSDNEEEESNEPTDGAYDPDETEVSSSDGIWHSYHTEDEAQDYNQVQAAENAQDNQNQQQVTEQGENYEENYGYDYIAHNYDPVADYDNYYANEEVDQSNNFNLQEFLDDINNDYQAQDDHEPEPEPEPEPDNNDDDDK